MSPRVGGGTFAPSRQSQQHVGLTQEQLRGYFNPRRSAAPSFGTASRFTNSQPNRHAGSHQSPPNSRNFRSPGRPNTARTRGGGGGGGGPSNPQNQFAGVDPSHIDPYGSFATASKSAFNAGAREGVKRNATLHVPGPGYYSPGGPTTTGLLSGINQSTGPSFGKASRTLASSGQPQTREETKQRLNPVVGPGRYVTETADALVKPRVTGGSWGKASKTIGTGRSLTRAQSTLGGNAKGEATRYQDAMLTSSSLQQGFPGPGNYNIGSTNVESHHYNDRQGGAMARSGRAALHHRETASARAVPGPGYYTPLYGA
jgi:hypothetical protein